MLFHARADALPEQVDVLTVELDQARHDAQASQERGRRSLERPMRDGARGQLVAVCSGQRVASTAEMTKPARAARPFTISATAPLVCPDRQRRSAPPQPCRQGGAAGETPARRRSSFDSFLQEEGILEEVERRCCQYHFARRRTMATSDDWKIGHQQHNAERATRVANATKCLKLVRSFMPLGDVVDFGCGIGAWVYAAEQLGATSALGIEGDWITGTDTIVDKAKIRIADLAADPPIFTKEFDLAMAIEVAEHLPEASADAFCRSLASASNRILFSAAIPKQGGVGHVNEQPLPYWVEKFWALGYVPLELIRPYIANDKSVYFWLRQNLIMFVAYDELVRSSDLIRHARPIGDFRLYYRSL
jgi:hypothetical protein